MLELSRDVLKPCVPEELESTSYINIYLNVNLSLLSVPRAVVFSFLRAFLRLFYGSSLGFPFHSHQDTTD